MKVLTESEIANVDVVNDILTETVNNLLTLETKSFLHNRSNREKLLELHGKKAFLDPDNLRFPLIDESGKFSKNLVKAAYIRARQKGKTDIAHKAKAILRGDDTPSNNQYDVGKTFFKTKTPQTKIQIKESSNEFDVCDILEMIDYDFSLINK